MNNTPRNLRYPTTVPSDEKTRPSRNSLAWTPSGDDMASPHRNNKGVKKLRKILRDKKGIQTILAALLMVVIVVVASVMVYAWSTGLLGSLLVKPTVGQEVLSLDSYTFNTVGLNANHNVSLFLRNTGSISVSFSTYYVKDLNSGTQYARPSGWTGGPINPQTVVRIDITTDNTITFTTGSWDITTITGRGNQFVYRVTK